MAQAPSTWTNDSTFQDLPSFDIEGRGLCVSAAPAGSGSWGVEGFVFTNDSEAFGSTALDWYRIHNRQGSLYLYGREARGEWGLVRVIQGDAWGGTQCGTTPAWRLPTPVPANAITGLTLDYERNRSHLLTSDDSWLMLAMNLWLDAPDYPKPLVIDFVLYHACNNAPDCGLRHFEDDDAFHYMQPIDDLTATDYAAIIAEARETTYLPECDTTACIGTLPATMPFAQQFEFVIEVHQAEAAAIVHELALHLDPTVLSATP